MLGSGINPESFKQDYSGFANAAATQAQGVANLGANIGGAIAEVGDYFKKQKEDEKKVQKSLSVAKAIGDLIPGLQPTIQDSLNILNDKELPLSQRIAEADAISDILNLGINEVRNRQDVGFKERELGIREAEALARNAPPMPEPFGFTGSELKKTDKGSLYVLKGNDGLDYDPKTKLPIFDLAAFGEGLPPEVWSGTSTFSDDQGSITTPFASLPREGASDAIDYANSLTRNMQGSGFPTNLNVARPAPFLSPSQIESAANMGTNPLLGSRSGDNGDLPAIEAANQADLQSRYITDEGKTEEPVTITMERLSELIALGVRPSGVLNPDGTFNVTDFNTGSLPQGRTTKFNPETGQLEIIEGVGGGAKTEKAERAAKFQETRQTNFIIDKANEAEEIIDNSISTYGGGTLIDMAKATIPGTQEYKLKNQILPALKDSIALDSIRQLKAASPTGSTGLGSVTEKEGQRLENMYGVLDVNGDKVTLKNDIKRLKQTAFDYIHGTKEEREQALAKGSITKEQNDQVEQMYREQILGVTAPTKSTGSIPRSEEVEAIRKKYLTPPTQ
jgi:hypothetical protein